ncbi:MAG: zinc ribbon domain-containing protein [Thermodesulfovibrionales bacterium]|nr:zinc ribbon domain-containing protein [Thermodesulfovibrionales bacterium]
MICPFCKEEIKDGAIKCKHCGSMLDGTSNNKPKMVECPFCKEDIMEDLSKCPHCESELNKKETLTSKGQSSPYKNTNNIEAKSENPLLNQRKLKGGGILAIILLVVLAGILIKNCMGGFKFSDFFSSEEKSKNAEVIQPQNKEPKVRDVDLSSFGNIRLGMTFNELASFIKSKYPIMGDSDKWTYRQWLSDKKQGLAWQHNMNYSTKDYKSIFDGFFNGSIEVTFDDSKDEVLNSIIVGFTPSRFDEAYNIFSNKYGPPHKIEGEILQNAFGATFENKKCYWFDNKRKCRLLVQKYFGAIDNGRATYSKLP